MVRLDYPGCQGVRGGVGGDPGSRSIGFEDYVGPNNVRRSRRAILITIS